MSKIDTDAVTLLRDLHEAMSETASELSRARLLYEKQLFTSRGYISKLTHEDSEVALHLSQISADSIGCFATMSMLRKRLERLSRRVDRYLAVNEYRDRE